MTDSDWLRSIQVGDKVRMVSPFTRSSCVVRVEAVNRVRVTVEGGIKFNRRDGVECGKDWCWPRVLTSL